MTTTTDIPHPQSHPSLTLLHFYLFTYLYLHFFYRITLGNRKCIFSFLGYLPLHASFARMNLFKQWMDIVHLKDSIS